MISLAFKKILFKFVFWYSKLPPHKRKLINNFLFFSNKRLRSYYTIPKNNCSPVSNIYFIKNYKDFQIIKNSFIGKNIRDSIGTQEVFNHRAKMCSLAAQGKWSKELETKS